MKIGNDDGCHMRNSFHLPDDNGAGYPIDGCTKDRERTFGVDILAGIPFVMVKRHWEPESQTISRQPTSNGLEHFAPTLWDLLNCRHGFSNRSNGKCIRRFQGHFINWLIFLEVEMIQANQDTFPTLLGFFYGAFSQH